MYQILFFCLLGYLLGSLPAGFLLVRWRKGIDIRRAGSGNVGAMNSFLVTGSVTLGLMVMLVDGLKGLAAVRLAAALGGGEYSAQASAAIGAVVGHCFPVWLGWKGGRGLATAAGAMATMAPVIIGIWSLLWSLGFAAVREINVASAIACLVAAAFLLALPAPSEVPGWLLPASPAGARIMVTALFAVLLLRLHGPVREYLQARRVSDGGR